jgi:hypothetical protein
MKKNLYFILGSAIIIGAYFYFKNKKKVADDKIKADESAKEKEIAKAEEVLKKDFEVAVQESGQVQAEAMNINLINEKKAKSLMTTYDAIWRQIFSMGTVKSSNPILILLKGQIKEIEDAVNKLGYRIDSNPRSPSGSQIIKKV